MKYGMLIDYGYCTGCDSCVVSCAKEKNLPADEWGIAVQQIGPIKMNGSWEWDYLPVPSSNCDLCQSRLEEGKQPLCQLHCLSKVIEVMPIEDLSNRMVELGRKKVVTYIP